MSNGSRNGASSPKRSKRPREPSPTSTGGGGEQNTVKEFNDFYFVRENENPTDVTFIVGGCDEKPTETFRAHKSTLAKGSTVFNAMFDGQSFIEGASEQATIKLPDIQPDAFYMVLKYLYGKFYECDHGAQLPGRPWGLTGMNRREFELSFKSTEFLGSLIYAADKYDLKILSLMCTSRMDDRLDNSNAVTIYQLCNQHSLNIMEKKAKTYLIKNFDEIVMEEDDFLNFTRENLMTFLARDDIAILEHDLFLGVLNWARHTCHQIELEPNNENCRLILDDAINLIRFRTISCSNLARYVSPQGFLSLEERCALLESSVIRENTSSSPVGPSKPHSSTSATPRPRAPYAGNLYFDVYGPFDSTGIGPLGLNRTICDKFVGNHDFKLTTLTYCPISSVSWSSPVKGEILIEEEGSNKEFHAVKVTSILENTNGRSKHEWIRFVLKMEVILKANVKYTISFRKSCNTQVHFETYNFAEGRGLITQNYNKRFTLSIYPVDKVIRRIGFVLV